VHCIAFNDKKISLSTIVQYTVFIVPADGRRGDVGMILQLCMFDSSTAFRTINSSSESSQIGHLLKGYYTR
jgi:hypothetical protein